MRYLTSSRTGFTLAMLIVIVTVGLGLWSQSLARVNGQLAIERERPATRLPDLSAALARAIACLRIAEPPAADYRCRLVLGTGGVPRPFTAEYAGTGGGNWTLTVRERWSAADPLCAECDPSTTR